MKSYVLALLLVIILLVAGCGQKNPGQQQQTGKTLDDQSQESEEIPSSSDTLETPVLDDVTDVEILEENLSPVDSTEDDYGDII